ncbi:integrase [Streptomyces sp. BHT-5-2]|uniref:integrase n=1 Tax=Streptomyces sp. BHT-5-2 TaxID=2866715 RepID=UPI001C8DF1B3|nr:integrase [Streptomyces sp. BHT-5-2]QZL04238.1 integrase [Streptomyces sp. BHT-5-2]
MECNTAGGLRCECLVRTHPAQSPHGSIRTRPLRTQADCSSPTLSSPTLPPHIAQVIAGHQDINVTLGYKAVYPDEAGQAHLAFLARRRAMRPTDEYRVPTDEKWTEFLGHFERRKVSIGTCGRSFSTPCIHEHACVRRPMLWPDPAQRDRMVEIRDNLHARIAEAEREGWLGEAEGLRVSLAGAEDKLAQLDRRRGNGAPVDLGIPTHHHGK